MENRSKVYQMDLERKDGAIVFDEIDEQQSSTHSPSDDLKWKSSSQRNFDSSNASPTRSRESFLEVILEGILKIMSVQSIRVDVIPVVIIIILLKIAHIINPDHLHHERCSLKKMLTGKLWTKIKINAEN